MRHNAHTDHLSHILTTALVLGTSPDHRPCLDTTSAKRLGFHQRWRGSRDAVILPRGNQHSVSGVRHPGAAWMRLVWFAECSIVAAKSMVPVSWWWIVWCGCRLGG